METFLDILRHIKDFLGIPLFKLGETQLTIRALLTLVLLLMALFYITGKIRNWVVNKLLIKSEVDVGTREAMGTLVRYVVIGIGLLVIFQTLGIDLTPLNVLAGTVGIGIGFGLQNIANNFISGLIILLERPIKVGDRIEVGSVEGDVIKIGARSTTVLTNDDIAIIVPNSKFITENVVNWSHTGARVRFRIPVSVAYGSDVRLVENLLLEVAKENPDVLDDPPPGVRLLAFGDSGLLFELRAWSASLAHRKGLLISALNYAIYEKFQRHGIEIPFPQRDLRIRNGLIEVKSPCQLDKTQ